MSRTNNPFAPSPSSEVQMTAQKYPDLTAEVGQMSTGQPAQQYNGQGHQQYYTQGQPQQQMYSAQGGGSSYLQSQPTGFQPTTSFGQQLQQQQQTGYPQTQYNQYSNYNNNHQQQQQSTPQVSFSVQDLDPYSQGLETLANRGQQQQGASSGNGRILPTNLTTVQQTQSHPRAYLHDPQAKQALTNWDEYAWKQLLSRVDSLREGWEARKSSIQQLGNAGGDPTSIDRLRREADEHIDTIHAAKMQLSEVKEGWRHSTDVASKSRVREALNAGLSSLPEYPPQLTAEQIGGQYHQRAYQDQQKQHIMSGYQSQQQQTQQTGMGYGGGMGGYGQGAGGGFGAMQPQQTGYYPQQGYTGGIQQGMSMQPQQTGFYGMQQHQQGGYPGQQQFY